MSLLKARTDIITPAEKQFWHEQAQRAPQLLRVEISKADKELTSDLPMKKVAGIGLGAALGAASFSERVPGYWKLLTGGSAVVAGVIGWEAWAKQDKAQTVRRDLADYANTLESTPVMSNPLGEYLATHVTAENIQKDGLDKSVLLHTKLFAIENGLYFPGGATPYLSK